jgi:hypothetical protein
MSVGFNVTCFFRILTKIGVHLQTVVKFINNNLTKFHLLEFVLFRPTDVQKYG